MIYVAFSTRLDMRGSFDVNISNLIGELDFDSLFIRELFSDLNDDDFPAFFFDSLNINGVNDIDGTTPISVGLVNDKGDTVAFDGLFDISSEQAFLNSFVSSYIIFELENNNSTVRLNITNMTGIKVGDLLDNLTLNQLLTQFPNDHSITGGQYNDVLIGSKEDDQLFGENGNDILRGKAGDDVLGGGIGNDRIIGGSGNDWLGGYSGNDKLKGRLGDDKLIGGRGQDILKGGEDNDWLIGEQGKDILNGGPGSDQLEGGKARDILNGGDGNDYLSGGNGADILNGGAGDDTISGGKKNDTLNGGIGNDQIIGGSGNDTILYDPYDTLIVYGGRGTDTLRIDGMGHNLNLSIINDNIYQSIEIIDLTGAGDNSLILGADDVLHISDGFNAFVDDNTSQLLIRGDTGDEVLSSDQGWIKGDIIPIGEEFYTSYTHADDSIQLLIDTDITQFIS